jgi:hypothetical protein
VHILVSGIESCCVRNQAQFLAIWSVLTQNTNSSISLQSDDDTLDAAVGGDVGLVVASMAAPSESVDRGDSLGLEFSVDVGTSVVSCIGELLTDTTTGTGAPVNGRRTAIGDEVAGAVVTTGARFSGSNCIVGFSVVVVVGDTTGAVDETCIAGASVGSVGGHEDTSLPGPASLDNKVGDMLGNSVYNGLRLASFTAVTPAGGASSVSVELGPPAGEDKGSMLSSSSIILLMSDT